METAFSTRQYDQAYPDGGEWHWWPVARTRIVRKAVDGALRDTRNTDAPMLEVGCGRGLVVSSLRASGYDCRGVDAAAVEPIEGARGFVESGVDATALPVEVRRRIETILLLDVIEHLPDPIGFLREIVAAFPALSRVIVTVPARQELWSNYDEYYGHYRRYSMAMLAAHADELGWRTRFCSYFFHSLYLPAWLVTRISGKRSTAITAPGPVGRIVHKLVALAMLADYALLPRRLVGTSLIASFDIGRVAAA